MIYDYLSFDKGKNMSTMSSKLKNLKVRSPQHVNLAGMTVWDSFAQDGLASYGQIFQMRPIDRAGLIKKGAPASMLIQISTDMGFSRDKVGKMIGVPPATASRRLAKNANLSMEESERLVGLTKLIGQVESIVRESGDATNFEPARWFSRWIETPVQALGNKKPEEFLDTSDGREAISTLLAQMQSGAYA